MDLAFEGGRNGRQAECAASCDKRSSAGTVESNETHTAIKAVPLPGKDMQPALSSDEQTSVDTWDREIRKPESIRKSSSCGKNGALSPGIASHQQLPAPECVPLQDATAGNTPAAINSIPDKAGSSPDSESRAETRTMSADCIAAVNATGVPVTPVAADSSAPGMAQETKIEDVPQTSPALEAQGRTQMPGEMASSAAALFSIPASTIDPEPTPTSMEVRADAGISRAANIQNLLTPRDSLAPALKRDSKDQAAPVAKMSPKASARALRDISDAEGDSAIPAGKSSQRSGNDVQPSHTQSAGQHEPGLAPVVQQQTIAVHEVQTAGVTHLSTATPVALIGNAPASASLASDSAANHAVMQQHAVLDESNGLDSGTTLPGIVSARLMQAGDQSEMRVGMHSAEFGDISIHTSVSQQQMLAQISVDHSELRNAIAAHIPAVQWRLGSEHGVHTSIEVSQAGYTFSGDRGQSSSRDPHHFMRATPIQDLAPEVQIDSSLRAPPVAVEEYRLDIRA